MHINRNPEFLHHKQGGLSSSLLREIVFGMEDGMVSTMGAITGIAFGTNNHQTILLAGFVIVAVESISMGVGSYLSNKSERAMDERMIEEEKTEIKEYPEEEKEELIEMFIADGWSKKLAVEMAEEASKNKDLMLQEMAYRELKVQLTINEHPWQKALYMGSSYIIGGMIPIIPYLVLDLQNALITSVTATLIALFALGAFTTKFTKRHWFKAGAEMFILASIAAGIGFGVAQLANMWS